MKTRFFGFALGGEAALRLQRPTATAVRAVPWHGTRGAQCKLDAQRLIYNFAFGAESRWIRRRTLTSTGRDSGSIQTGGGAVAH